MAPARGFRVLIRRSYHWAAMSILDGSPDGVLGWISTLGGSPPVARPDPLLPAPAARQCRDRPPPNLSPSAGAVARSTSWKAVSTGESSPVCQAADRLTVGASPVSSR